MRTHLNLFTTATRYDLIEHARNRFAMLLVVFFIPTWVGLIYLTMLDKAAPFRLVSTGEKLAPAGNQLTQITGAVNCVTLVTGFMMFAVTFTGGRFDRRLAMAGYPRTHLVLAKAASLILASALLAAYATAAMCIAWTPKQPYLLAAALFCAALTYGALGVVFGSLLSREVEGMFAMVMTSVIDVTLQNPVISAGADSPLTRWLPTYGSVQASTAAGFSTTPVPAYLALQLLWFAATALLGLLAFHHRTRNALPQPSRHGRMAPALSPADRSTGTHSGPRLQDSGPTKEHA
ncbi:ABC transporter permease [Streptomyces sp. NPDC006235]|uniref:ABC transporter permease n=1 Tax=Streptomyces sp. NPDC006235 TaxID=3156736 RepID=UPI0033AFBEB1